LATCPRYFPNHLEVEIELTRAKSPFYLMGAKANANLYAINITGANIQYRAVIINPTVGLAHVIALEKVNAIYPYKEVKVKTTPIPATSNKLTISNIHNGVLPNLMYIGFVDSRAFAGTTEFNAFNFQHFGLTDLLVTCGTNIIPYQKTLSFDFVNKNYALAHNTLTQTNQQTEIHYEDYPNGNALFGFNFTPDLCTVNNFNIQKTGNIEVALQFADQLPQAFHAIFYLEFDNVLEITDKRVAIVTIYKWMV